MHAAFNWFVLGFCLQLSLNQRKLAQRSERVKSVDLHPTEPWILASLYSGTVGIWNYQSQASSFFFIFFLFEIYSFGMKQLRPD
ncbi:hypothetical protein ZIOFF_028768 [Zingiber officinale]|uniref:Uncharacterized protein n=1 Tax=Zingiber officinale TaxID=94328 RepID=A0A8J5L9I5_ZINOF|nr:hypothetical protein ZIOFF_028768 [Zingiber officinale]